MSYFYLAAKDYVRRLNPVNPERVIYAFLIREARGRLNAKSWGHIEEELDRHDMRLSQTAFQQTILKDSRAGNIFIGSNDVSPTRGYFLICNRKDARCACEFYERRITAQTVNLMHLNKLITECWPQEDDL